MNNKLIAITALSAFAAVSAHAFQGEQNPLPPQPFHSTESRGEVASGARQPLIISNGGTGVLQTKGSTVDRASVRAGAVAITRDGAATYGEVTDRKM
jgi:hypothetical protein